MITIIHPGEILMEEFLMEGRYFAIKICETVRRNSTKITPTVTKFLQQLN